MNNIYILPIVLQVIGILVIMAEILLPSGGLLSMLAIGLFGYSLYYVFNSISSSIGMVFLIMDIITIPIAILAGFKLLAKSPIALKKKLSSEDGVVAQSADAQKYIGKEGIAFTDLRPAGIAMIESERLDVVTEGKYLDKDTKIVVVSVSGNQIIVNQILN
ncbi:MAG: serine protease [Deltaproteobacteria bacterium]|jgi:membrane-bound ClpP family serine protease|nr:serine protease [Deltaproteobacteria bacterium]MBT4525884.1 serine protease [Deltaproteobacteria bacterium]